MAEHLPPGSVSWMDLTVDDAEKTMEFYRDVVGWNVVEFDMGQYADFCVNRASDDKTIAGICHARGANADLPPQWLIYITVEDLEASMRKCKERGGELLTPVRSCGGQGTYCVIRDPAGAVAALLQPPDNSESDDAQ